MCREPKPSRVFNEQRNVHRLQFPRRAAPRPGDPVLLEAAVRAEPVVHRSHVLRRDEHERRGKGVTRTGEQRLVEVGQRVTSRIACASMSSARAPT